MSTKRVVLPLVFLLALVFVAPATALASARGWHGGSGGFVAGRDFRGGFVVHRGFIHDRFWYGPGWYGPYWYGAYPYVYDDTGTVQVRAFPEGGPKAELYLNGGLVNSFKSKDSVNLEPGQYTVEVRKPGYASETQSVYVTTGRTLKLEFDLEPEG